MQFVTGVKKTEEEFGSRAMVKEGRYIAIKGKKNLEKEDCKVDQVSVKCNQARRREELLSANIRRKKHSITLGSPSGDVPRLRFQQAAG